MGDDGFFSVFGDFSNYISGKKKGGFGKYDKVIDRTLEEIPNKKSSSKTSSMPARRKFGPKTTSRRKYSTSYVRSSNKKRKRTYKPKKSLKKRKKTYKKKTSVPLTCGTSRQRFARHQALPNAAAGTNVAYAAFSSIGERGKQSRGLAEAVLLYYMRKVGDVRASHVHVDDATWHEMAFTWIHKNTISTTEATDTLESHTGSFEASPPKNLNAMVSELAVIFRDRAQEGMHLARVVIRRRDVKSTDLNQYIQRDIYNDVAAGTNIISFSSKSVFKIQNTTEADFTSDRANMMNIHRNPLDGYAYKFKNQIPQLKSVYLAAKDDTDRAALDNMTNCYSSALGGVTIPNEMAFQEEFKIPTNTPSVMFNNVMGKTRTSIQPGGHKSFYLSELYTGTINQYVDRYFHTADVASDNMGKIPPGGSCMVIALKPTYRTSGTEDISLECEHDIMYQHYVKTGKKTPLPIMNTIIGS